MSRLDQLPADQHAVLSLLVRQGRTYAQVAALLAIDESAVRGRAQRALSTLGGRLPAGLAGEESERIGDYLLGQLADAERIETLARLMDAPAGRAWARTVAGELSSLATVPLPAVPDEPLRSEASAGREPLRTEKRAARDARSERQARIEIDAPEPRPREPRRPPAQAERGRGVLLAAAVLAIVAIVVFIVDGAGTSSPAAGPIPASAATQTGTGSTSSSAIVAQLTLKPTTASSKATGVTEIVRSGSALQIAFSAANLPSPGSGHYVLWLYDSPTHFEALGEVQSVNANGSVGPLAVTLPSDASSYHGVLLTLETSSSPTSPGPEVLSGTSSSPL